MMDIYFAPDFSWLLVRSGPPFFDISPRPVLPPWLLAHDLSDHQKTGLEKTQPKIKMNKARGLLKGLVGLIMVFSFAVLARAEEFPIGEPLEKHGMKIAAVYVEPAVSQDEYWGGVPREEGAVIHLEADIHATKENKHGFGDGEWIPYLTVFYRLRNLKTDEEQKGLLWQMVAKDGPHYGRNITLRPGKYKLVYTIENPSTGGLARHTDKETGVQEWWDAFSLEYTFEYSGSKNRP